MFNKKDQRTIKVNMRRMKGIRRGSEKREEKRAETEEETVFGSDQVKEMVSFYSLLAARFGMFVLFQLQNQKDTIAILKEQVSEETGLDLSELENNKLLMEKLNSKDLANKIGADTKAMIIDQFLDSEHIEMAQQIILHHFEDEKENFCSIVKSFNDQLMEEIQKRQSEGMEPVSNTIN